jgi:acetyltransferase-like isoleucine patch superfamily enzyme
LINTAVRAIFILVNRIKHPGTKIYSFSKVAQSFIGRRSVVHKNTFVKKSKISCNVIIHDQSIINSSSVDEFSIVYKNSNINNSAIGKCSYISQDSLINVTTIGSFCSIGPRFLSGLGDHPLIKLSTSPVFYSPENRCNYTFAKSTDYNEFKPVTIGNDVWIGANVFVRNGVSIGNGAVIAAGSVVVNDVPDFSIVAGVPAKIKKYRLTDSEIEKVNSLKWWDWSFEEIREKISLFQ